MENMAQKVVEQSAPTNEWQWVIWAFLVFGLVVFFIFVKWGLPVFVARKDKQEELNLLRRKKDLEHEEDHKVIREMSTQITLVVDHLATLSKEVAALRTEMRESRLEMKNDFNARVDKVEDNVNNAHKRISDHIKGGDNAQSR